MTDADRGAYTPSTDAPLSFDARQPVRGARPVPFTLIISAVVLVALIGAVFFFYQGGVRQAGDAPQTVGTPVGDLRAAAPAEPEATDPAEGLQIYRTDSTDPAAGEPRFAPPPEQPAPRPVAAEPPPAAAPTTPVIAQPTPLPAAPPAAKAAPIQVVAAPKAPAAPAPKAPPAKAAAAPEPKLAVATPAPKTAAPAAAGGSASVQIGAFATRELAESALGNVSGVSGNPGGRNIEPAPGTGLFRAKVTGFSSRADAAAFCNQLKASGKQCFVR